MPRLEGEHSQSETISLRLRTDVLLSRRDGNQEIKDRTLVWNFQVDIPVWSTRLHLNPASVVVNEIMYLVGKQFQENGFVQEIAQRTADLLAQDM